MLISILNESLNNEKRVSATPDSVRDLIKNGASIIFEKGAGFESGYLDKEYISAGAKIAERLECLNKADICLVVKIPSQKDITELKLNSILIGMLNPYQNKNLLGNINY